MKDKKSMVIVCLAVLIIKVLGGLLTKSFTLISTGILEGVLLTYFLLATNKTSKKYDGIITSLMGLIIIIISLALLFLCIIRPVTKPSFFIILFVVICVLAKYAVTSLKINSTYNKRKGLLATSNVRSNLEFYTYGVILGSLIIARLGRFFSVLKYGDKIGTTLITGITIYYGLRLIASSIRYMEDKEPTLPEGYNEEITKRPEVKRLESVTVRNFGGLRIASANLEIKEGVSLVDVNTFAVTLEDYLLKTADVIEVNMINSVNTGTKKNKPKVVSKKAEAIKNAKAKKKPNGSSKSNNSKGSKNNARNSGSRNGKTGSKKKNNKKTNKKR